MPSYEQSIFALIVSHTLISLIKILQLTYTFKVYDPKLKYHRLYWLKCFLPDCASTFISCISTSYNAKDSLFPSSSSLGRYSTKSIFTSVFSSSPSPTMIKMSPGTIKPKLRAVRALSAAYMSSRWHRTAIMSIVKQLLMRTITLENICLMRILPIIRLNPSMMPM
jgi:hypothetical protein